MESSKFNTRVDQIFKDLEQYNYYELLNLAQGASDEEIRGAFHRMALSLHPDRHATSEDMEQLRKINTIYKRIAEGYRVLMNPKAREEYDQGVKEGQVRLVKKERKKSGPEHPEDAIDDQQAKKFFMIGLKAEREGDLQTALLNYKFATDLVGDQPNIVKRRDWINRMLGKTK